MDGYGNYVEGGLQSVVAKSHDNDGMALGITDHSGGTSWSHLVSFEWSDAGNSISANSNLSAIGKWLNITWTFSNTTNTAFVYANGTLVGQNLNFHQDFSSINNNDLFIGKYSDYWYPLNGAVDDVLIYDRALTAAEVGIIGGSEPAVSMNDVKIGAMMATLVYGDGALTANPVVNIETTAQSYDGTNPSDDGFDDNYQQYFKDVSIYGETWSLLTGTDLSLTTIDNTHAVFTSGGLYCGYIDNGLPHGNPDGDSNAMVVTQGDTLVLAFRGTDDVDSAITGAQTWTGHGAYYHYEAFRPLMDSIKNYLESHKEIKNFIVSGHSLGGMLADVFTLVDKKTFDAINGVDVRVVSLASPGIDPDLLADSSGSFRDHYDTSIATVYTGSIGQNAVNLTNPTNYIGFAHNKDRVFNEHEDSFGLGLNPNELLWGNENFTTNILNIPNIKNTDVVYPVYVGSWSDPDPRPDSGFGAHHNAQIYCRNISALTSGDLAQYVDSTYFGSMIFGVGHYGNDASWFKGNSVDDNASRPLNGTDGKDFIAGLEGNDFLNGGGSDDLLDGGTGNDRLAGDAGNDRLAAGAGADTLNGGVGIDTMIGGDGNDLYVIDQNTDVIIETNSDVKIGGTDTVNSGLTSYTLMSNFENGVITISTAADMTGNDFGNVITAGNGDNTIDGRGGVDTVSYSRALSAVMVSLSLTGAQTTGGSGIDTITDVERLTGSNFADVLMGNTGSNTINGGTGADSMSGGNGSDTYYVDNDDDVISELAGVAGDVDVVYTSSARYEMADNIENGYINTTATSTLIGNSLNNVIYAGSGNNFLSGYAGIDTVNYSLATAAVTISFSVRLSEVQITNGSGIDTVIDFENITGSNYGDTLTGDAGINVINGGKGGDTMTGGDGSDTYYIDNLLDKVIETNSVASSGGTDLVLSSLLTYTLGANIENGRITSSDVAAIFGNSLNNVLYSGAGANSINGGAGTDTVHYGYASSAVTVSLAVATGQSTGGSNIDILTNIENLTGSKYADKLTGNTANNNLNGGVNNDTLSGGSGNDTLIGGEGKDSLTGGAGTDIFDFNALAELGLGSANRDVIRDFAVGADKIDLSTIDPNAVQSGNQAFNFVTSFSTAGSQVRYSGGIVYLNTDTDVAAEYEIQLAGVVPTSLTAVSFML